MRLFLIPLTPRRAFVYGHHVAQEVTKKRSLLDRAITKSSDIWLKWEKYEKGWQKQLTVHGNRLLRRIPYQEWSLKSISALPRNIPDNERQKVPVVYPPSVMTPGEIPRLLHKLGTENSGMHRRLLMWCLIGMPISAPFALVPIIPNIPFFYLVFRAYSHWRALQGGRHLEFLVKNNLLDPQPDTQLDRIYKTKIERVVEDVNIDKETIQQAAEAGVMDEAAEEHLQEEFELIGEPTAKEVAEVLKIPQLVVELERACEQVHEQVEEKRKGVKKEL
ncbi:hypothetical protein TWF569_004972 [Orbilia oligospora]|uniref:Mitochondrial K+-H+ exchange-related-domain-containing protein n=1 Tax=Orbilia oligospora TaxID=2813651 RepID=A0A7C8PCC4_ORBOL|nr:hypothetical protein TWF103_003684 [Orbilia oligospora]KAF3089252.1 hypothetical protein TWF102_009743 [Orbilia oligospora]KAF3090279.1 hypothetical protein TWF706_009915 [Orbilia oligospora]KAF3126722.1 hypothetical protein TWF594_000855 [Orbilia oligospora]KAF3146657.1 hypothetical protein TWF703_003928 [Orbilia oligospora]